MAITPGNGVFRPAAKKIVAHAQCARAAEGGRGAQTAQPAPPPTLPDTTFPETWQAPRRRGVPAKHYGPAHTGGDIVVFFEKANVVHMGDLMFNRRHPFIDRPAGASIAGWITALEQMAKAHGADTHVHLRPRRRRWKVTGRERT